MFTRNATEAAKKHALAEWPQECCGIIDNTGAYVPMVNVSPNPREKFDCDAQRRPYMLAGRVRAMVHSHPYPQVARAFYEVPPDFGPSEHDMRSQAADALPWGIMATDGYVCSDPVFFGLPTAVPLEGRSFRHGPSGTDGKGDCYALIRDFYAEQGTILPEFPRSWLWWEGGADLYMQGFASAGFRRIDSSEARPGDVFLMKVRSQTTNHGGVLLDGGQILHHLVHRVSRREPLLPWRRMIHVWLRHD